MDVWPIYDKILLKSIIYRFNNVYIPYNEYILFLLIDKLFNLYNVFNDIILVI